jgi:hypothetical protein
LVLPGAKEELGLAGTVDFRAKLLLQGLDGRGLGCERSHQRGNGDRPRAVATIPLTGLAGEELAIPLRFDPRVEFDQDRDRL